MSNYVLYWGNLVDLGIIGVLILFANTLRRKVPFLKKYVIPTSIIAGFIGLGLKYLLTIKTGSGAAWGSIDGRPLLGGEFMGIVAYHTLALGFIASSLRNTSNKEKKGVAKGGTIKTGLTIVTSYLMQAGLGLVITIAGYYIWKNTESLMASGPHSGVIIALAFGQGPGNAMNTGRTFDLTLIGQGLLPVGSNIWESWGLSLAAIGFLAACIPGIIYINYLVKKKKIVRYEGADDIKVEETSQFAEENEIPLSESVDKFTVQIAFVLGIYFITWLLLYGIEALLSLGYKSGESNIFNTVSNLIWGFNFIFAIVATMIVKLLVNLLQKKKIMKRKYTNDFMLTRISGLAFDFMVVAALTAIDVTIFKDAGLIIVLIVASLVGAIATFFLNRYQARKWFASYEYEAFFSLYGTLTGTNSTGIALLREIDPYFETPAANNLVNGAASAVLFGGPLLIAIAFVQNWPNYGWWYLPVITLGILLLFGIYMIVGEWYNKRMAKEEVIEKSVEE